MVKKIKYFGGKKYMLRGTYDTHHDARKVAKHRKKKYKGQWFIVKEEDEGFMFFETLYHLYTTK